MIGFTATHVDADTFTVALDKTADFIAGRRVKANCGADGYKYGTVESSSYSSPNTTVNLVSSNDDLTSNLAEVWYSSVKPGSAGNVSMHPHAGDEGDGYSIGRYSADHNETDQGVVGNGKTIKAFIDAIGSDKATIYLRHNSGGATTAYTLTASETIPSNISLEIENGTILDGAGTLTINGPFKAELYQVFGSSISIAFGKGFVEKVYPQWWGAIGDGTTDDTAAVQLAIIAAEGHRLRFVAGIYLVDNLTGVSNTEWAGDGIGVTTIKARGALTVDLVKFTSKTNYQIHDITIDYDNVGTTGTIGALGNLYGTNFKIYRCEIEKFVTLGIGGNACTDFNIRNNIITKDFMSLSLNQAILLTNSGGVLSDAHISNNICTNSGIIIQGYNLTVNNNNISGWGYGAGISTQGEAGSYNNILHGNIIYSSNPALDDDGTAPSGIESWATRTSIQGNIIYGCASSGLSIFGKKTIVANNICYNNGTYVGAAGITLGYYDATHSASDCVVTGNRCFDSLGAGGDQTYGIEAHTSIINTIVTGNALTGNKTGNYLPCFKTLANEATPTVAGGEKFLTGGTTTITDFDDGVTGKIIRIISEHAITITDGTNIFLNGSVNFVMAATDTLTLICKADNNWYELARSDNT